MDGKVRKTGLKELTGDNEKLNAARHPERVRHAAFASGAGYVRSRKAGKVYREFRKNEWTDMDGIPHEIYDSLLELDGILEKMDSYGTDDGFGENVRFNECYFDAVRAGELLAGINYRLNRISAGEKKATEKNGSKTKQINRLYGLTGALEESIKVLKDSLEREHKLGSHGMEKGNAPRVLRPSSEDV